jgi:hypothetical protein
MLAKGKTPKVLIAAARREPVVNIPEGSEPQGSVTRLRKEQSFTARQVASLHIFAVATRLQPLSLPALEGRTRFLAEELMMVR